MKQPTRTHIITVALVALTFIAGSWVVAENVASLFAHLEVEQALIIFSLSHKPVRNEQIMTAFSPEDRKMDNFDLCELAQQYGTPLYVYSGCGGLSIPTNNMCMH